MRFKKDKGLAGVDIVIAIIVLMVFSTLIISLIYNNVAENVKLKKETLAMIYITEIFENVGIESYENLENGSYEDLGKNDYTDIIENLVPEDAKTGYRVDIVITNELENVENNEDIMKKVVITLTYSVNDKNYTCSMERMKIKE